MDKKGAFKGLTVDSIVGGVIILVLAFNVLALGLPLVVSAGDNLANTGLPFASFFGSGGIIILAIVGSVVLGVIAYLGLKKGKR